MWYLYVERQTQVYQLTEDAVEIRIVDFAASMSCGWLAVLLRPCLVPK
jgi:hypothetical protein